MIIRGADSGRPVLLFLHGGPGSPEYALAESSSLRLEDDFTVCWWEQRGSGMSWSRDIEPGTITLDRMLEDAIEVTNYLRERFGAEKIYLMGHSWGSLLGVLLVDRHPEWYEAYIGIGQVTNQLESEKLAWAHMLETARAQGDRKMAEKLSAFQITGADSLTAQYFSLRNANMLTQDYGMFHEPVSMLTLTMQVLRAREYTLADKYGYVRGMLLDTGLPILESNLFECVSKLDVPVYIIHGKFDMQVSYQLSKAWFDVLEAPEKHFYSFENSAHSPFVEEPEKFMQIIRQDILHMEA